MKLPVDVRIFKRGVRRLKGDPLPPNGLYDHYNPGTFSRCNKFESDLGATYLTFYVSQTFQLMLLGSIFLFYKML
jgi:hypothetical protein